MATYKVVDADQLDQDMASVADTIRAKGGTTAPLAWPDGYQAAVNAIETGEALPSLSNPGKAEDLRVGKQLIDQEGNIVTGTALVAGGGGVKPDGAFAPVQAFTAGKQYALVAMIDGVRRYIDATAYNDWTLNAPTAAIAEDAGDYVLFGTTPALFTAVASGNGFLLQNGSNYLRGNADEYSTSLHVDGTTMVWTVDTSATAGIPSGKFYPKEDENAVWLTSVLGGNDCYIKLEEDADGLRFGFDYVDRNDQYSTGFISFVLYEHVAGEGEVNPVVDTSDATATAKDILRGASAYVKGEKIEGELDPGANVAGVTATAAEVLSPKVFVDKNGNQVVGTMTDQGAKTTTLNAGDSYTIPAGYHNGNGKVTANSLASQTSATAAAGDLLSGKTAWVNGSKVTGTLVVQTYRYGPNEPESTTGADGDLYFVMG